MRRVNRKHSGVFFPDLYKVSGSTFTVQYEMHSKNHRMLFCEMLFCVYTMLHTFFQANTIAPPNNICCSYSTMLANCGKTSDCAN